MRKAKTEAALKAKRKVIHHTPLERLAMTRRKRKEGPSGQRRFQRREEKRLAFARTLVIGSDVVVAVIQAVDDPSKIEAEK